jgi:hypothetical protein
MAKQQNRKSGKKGDQKTFASKRTANPPAGPNEEGLNKVDADQHQDAKRRLGGYGGKGEHPRTGNRGRQ